MTDTRDDPRYIRTAALTVLAALLVVASCQVEQPATVVEPEQVTGDAGLDAVDGTEQITVTPTGDAEAEETSPTADTEPEADDAPPDVAERTGRIVAPPTADEVRAAIEAFREAQDAGAVSENPVFTPMTVRPDILNRSEVQAALIAEYPPALRDAGIGGQVTVWFFISEDGTVLDRRISESSGQAALDAAALNVADVFRFSPALNREQIVQVWIQLPITFQVQP